MELTRRDAVAALGALGAGGAVVAGLRRYDRSSDAAGDDEQVYETLVAAAEVVYPDEVSGIETFVETYLEGRLDDPDHASGLHEAVTDLERLSAEWHGDGVDALSVADRDSLLREVSSDTADEDPDGTVAERVRYYVVNELLLALYASPTGGELVGIENPQGHAGGIDTYQRGPEP